jgi:hypothetical protein
MAECEGHLNSVSELGCTSKKIQLFTITKINISFLLKEIIAVDN